MYNDHLYPFFAKEKIGNIHKIEEREFYQQMSSNAEMYNLFWVKARFLIKLKSNLKFKVKAPTNKINVAI